MAEGTLLVALMRALLAVFVLPLYLACSAKGTDKSDIRILTLNLQTFNANPVVDLRTQMVIDYLKSTSPDLVAFQEAAESSEVRNRAEVIAAAAGYEHVWTSANMNQPLDYKGGSAVLSRWPIESQELEDLPFLGLEGEYQARAIRITSRTPVGRVNLVGVHVTAVDAPGLKTDQTITAANLLLRAQRRLPGFYAGDFNAEPNAPSIEALRDSGSFEDAWSAANPEASGHSYPANNPDRRIDYIFTVPGSESRAKTLRCSLFGDQSEGTRVSDHLGVLCDFRFERLQ